ncbi:MAG: Glycerophosphoryl diester esterase [uncultured bacterium]|nr:MAG: Glycerophosphoryl diester esterase [uncultured bacterium]
MITSLHFDPPVIGHRGACGYAPENTLASFTKAAQLGIKWVEFDVMLTADGKPVIFHDETLDRTTNATGNLGQFTFDYLSSLDAGAWFDTRFAGEKIPSLVTVLEWMKETGVSANVEIKPLPGQDRITVANAVKDIVEFFPQPSPSILFSSFSVDSLYYLREQLPTCYMGLLIHEWLPNWLQIVRELNCISVHVNEDIITRETALKIKSMEKFLLCYTVNDPARANELYTWGVDAVFSDVPDKIAAAYLPYLSE